MSSTQRNILDPEAIERAEALGLQARSIVEGYMAGEHKSPFRGFAIEFAQHREYTPGDDTRHLDWKVLGRSDRYYIKQYEQETNYVANILVDGSESMNYGSGAVTKFEYARTIAAVLSYLILLQRDAAALAIFDERIQEYHPRTDNMSSIHSLVSILADFEPTRETGISTVLHEMARQVRRRGIFILISDFFDDVDEVVRGIQHLRFTGGEVIVFHVLDPAEVAFNFVGTVEFHGLEGGVKVTTQPQGLRKSYLAAFQEFVDRLRLGCERNGCNYVQVKTDSPWHEVLSSYLATRQHRYG